MNISKNNFFIFLIHDLIFDDSNNFNLFEKKSNILNLFSLKRKFKVLNNFLLPIHSIYFFNKKNIDDNNKLLILNKDNILFLFFNNNLYSNKIIDLILNKSFLNLNLKNFYYFKSIKFTFLQIRFIYLLKVMVYLKNIKA